MNTKVSTVNIENHPYIDFIHQVAKPARYLGGEYQSLIKDPERVFADMVLCFPDLYDIGMSHLGTKILYSVIGKIPDLSLERAFCPWVDMEKELRDRQLPILSLETHRPLSDFDVVGFSLQYELTYTNVLTMLDLGCIPLHNSERTLDDPLVIAGGPTATHPEPMAPFIDIFLIGDGEEKLPQLLRQYKQLKNAGDKTRTEILVELSLEGGIYCPDLYDRSLCDRSDLLAVSAPKYKGVPKKVQRAFVEDINKYPFPDDSPVAVAEAIFDRMSIEIARGCTEGCRFCQAGQIYRPVRERDPQEIVKTLVSAVQKGGYDEAALTSLSTADYSCVSPLIKKVMAELRPKKIGLGISSLRAYGLDEDLLDEISSVKATGLTFAPEAGTQRMRDVVNKNITEEDILTTCHRVFSKGWGRMKLYFMIGLPTEEDEDVIGIAEFGKQALDIGRLYHKSGKVTVTVSVSSHIPKPHTPFQWCAQDSREEIHRKQEMLWGFSKKYKFKFRKHDLRSSHLEGILARGDYRVGDLIERVWRKGARFDGWDEQLRWDFWQQGLEEWEQENSLSRQIFLQTLPVDAKLPWDHIDVGLAEGFNLREYKRALKDRLSPPCGKPFQAKVHHTNLEDALEEKRKLICYSCGVACDMTQMKQERMEFLKKMGAEKRPGPRLEPNIRNQAMERINKGMSPHDFGQKQKIRYRMKYAKLGAMTLQGHLDMVRVLPRIFRRAQLPLYYSQGYSPKPVLMFSPALSLGMQSVAEFMDFTLTEEIPVKGMMEKLMYSADPGIHILGLKNLGTEEPPLSKVLQVIEYLIPWPGEFKEDQLQNKIHSALENNDFSVSVVRKRKVREILLKDVLVDMQLIWSESIKETNLLNLNPETPLIKIQIRETPGAGLKPAEIFSAVFNQETLPTGIIRNRCLFVNEKGEQQDLMDSITFKHKNYNDKKEKTQKNSYESHQNNNQDRTLVRSIY